MNGDTNDATDGEEDESDDDNDGGVSPEIVAKFIVRSKLQETASIETPGEETFLGCADP